jgi:iron complex transport system ATP-binding protein
MRACGDPLEVINPAMLRQVYCVDARIEKCSRRFDHVIVDGVAA